MKHPTYKGKEQPELSCKTCCSLYIGEIKKNRSAKKQIDPAALKEAANSDIARQSLGITINPESI